MRNQRVHPAVLGVALGLILAVGTEVTWVAQAQERAAVTTGARLFMEHGCYGCHRIKALGTPIGPDLSRVGAKYSERDLARWLTDPASQKPNAHMPKLELAPADVTALAAFLATQR
jgi:cbb3-type cytochrome oxidase cytochrome c subunit